MASISIHPIPEHSIIFLQGVDFKDDGEGMKSLLEIVEKTAGHKNFCVLQHFEDNKANVEVWGPDTDLEAKIRELLNGGSASSI